MALLAAAAICAGGFVISLHDAPAWVRWLLPACAVGLAASGLALARSGHIMEDTS